MRVLDRDFQLNDSFVFEAMGDCVLVMSPSTSEVFEFSEPYASVLKSMLIEKPGNLDLGNIEVIIMDLIKSGVVVKTQEVNVSRRIVLKGLSTLAITGITTMALPLAVANASTVPAPDPSPSPTPEMTMSTTPLETSVVVDGNDPGA